MSEQHHHDHHDNSLGIGGPTFLFFILGLFGFVRSIRWVTFLIMLSGLLVFVFAAPWGPPAPGTQADVGWVLVGFIWFGLGAIWWVSALAAGAGANKTREILGIDEDRAPPVSDSKFDIPWDYTHTRRG